MRTKPFAGIAAAILMTATLLSSCGNPAPSGPVEKAGVTATGAAATESGNVQAHEAKPVEQTPSQSAAADAFSNHDVKKCDLLGSGS